MGQVGRVWVDIGANASELKRAVSESKQALNSLTSDAATAGADTGTSLMGIASSATMAVGAILTVIKTAKEVYDFAEEGAKIASLELSSKKLAASYGANMSSIVNSVRDASFNTITEYDAMKAANLALTMGVSTNATEIANLMEIAIERGRAFGLTTEDAFDRITRGIGRRSTKILDDLGFTANATEANKAYADSIGIATSALTDDMKVRALFEQILKEGNAELAKQGGLMMDISTPYQKTGTKIKQIFADAQKTMAHIVAPFITSSEDLFKIEREEAAVAVLSGTYWEYSKAMQRAANTQRDYFGWLDSNRLTQGQFADAQRLTAQAMASQNTRIDEFVSSQEEANDSIILAIGLSREIAIAEESYAAAMEKAGGSTRKQQEAVNDLNESYEDFIINTLQGMGVSSKATMSVGYAFGEIDDKSIAVFSAIEQINTMFDVGSSQWVEALINVKNRMQDLDNIKIGDKSATITIYINYLVNGSPYPYQINNLPMPGVGDVFDIGIKPPGGMHGGSFIGMAHGGIVPPGFSNDGMPIMVSSGERLDVTPAGNKSVDTEELAGMVAGLMHAIEMLPINIRDSMQHMVM